MGGRFDHACMKRLSKPNASKNKAIVFERDVLSQSNSGLNGEELDVYDLLM